MTEAQAEAVAYGVAVLILVVGGMFLRTALLNWICGPGTVIACVALIPPLLRAREPGR